MTTPNIVTMHHFVRLPILAGTRMHFHFDHRARVKVRRAKPSDSAGFILNAPYDITQREVRVSLKDRAIYAAPKEVP